MSEPTPAPRAASPTEAFPYCRHLASKKLVLKGGLPRTDEDVLDASNHCWCTKTYKVTGPDQQPAHPQDCRADRPCYESPFAG